MKTNLIFKRQITIDGISRVITRIVPVEVPFISSGEGWVLSGHTDSVEVVDMSQVNVAPMSIEDYSKQEADIKKEVKVSDKFESDVKGTAKLVRSKGVIKIVARKGKSTFNQTTPNSVCIDDLTKNNFFKDCRIYNGEESGVYSFKVTDGRPYDYWNKVIDTEYNRQKTNVC